MKVHEKIKFMRQSKGWSQEDMAEKLYMSVNGYANIERGETDVKMSRLQQIAETFNIELLELLSFGEKHVFYLTDNSSIHAISNINDNSTFYHVKEDYKNNCEHELEKARLLLQQYEKEINYLKKIIHLMDKEKK